MMEAAPSSPNEPRFRIAVVPAYNEAATIVEVLEELTRKVDEVYVIDDGSTDATRALVEEWRAHHASVRFLSFDDNRGQSAALQLAFGDLRRRLSAGELGPDDVVITVDADGQHDLSALDGLWSTMTRGNFDAVIARRDLKQYPVLKRVGNAAMSWWARLWAGTPLRDVESGYRLFRLGALDDALCYYVGYRYTEAVEVAVILCRLGYRVNNDYLVPVPVLRSRTRIMDAVRDLVVMPRARWRTRRRLRQGASV